MINNNTLQVLSNIIYNIYNTEDFEAMKLNVLKAIQQVIPCKFATIFIAPPGEKLLSDPVTYPPEYVEMEYRYLENRDISLTSWIPQKEQSTIVRLTDLWATQDERENTEYHRLVHAPFDVHYAVYATLVSRSTLLGEIALYRNESAGDFSQDDLTRLSIIVDHLSARFLNQRAGIYSTYRANHLDGKMISEYSLTPRELEVLKLVIERKDNEEICEKLLISNNTLKKHFHNIYEKTHVSGKTELMGLIARLK